MLRMLVVVSTLSVVTACSREARPQKMEVSIAQDSPALFVTNGAGAPPPAITPVDLSYATTLTVGGPDANLSVWPREGGAAVTFKGVHIKATYSHVAGLLAVETQAVENAEPTYHYFVQPIHWGKI